MRTHRLLAAAALAMIALAASCGPTYDQELYDQIQVGMSQSEVEDLLGGAGTEETGMSITASGIPSTSNRASRNQTFTWKSNDLKQHITVTFKDGKVLNKAKSGF
jgi:hypothetical protein